MAYIVTDLTNQTVVLEPPMAQGMVLKVRKATNADVAARQDLFSEIKYVTSDEEGETTTIRKFPMGQMRRYTVMLVLKEWNLQLDDTSPVLPITEDNIDRYLPPAVFQWLYDEIIDMNPAWGGSEGEDD